MMIGQDRIVASPLAMAGVAATVAAGRWHAPRLLADDPRADGPALRERARCATLMRDVVTSGTGTALRGLPGDVIGKSGTAEYGGGDPPPTHAWFIAARDDLAVAVLVEDGRSGGDRRRADRGALPQRALITRAARPAPPAPRAPARASTPARRAPPAAARRPRRAASSARRAR